MSLSPLSVIHSLIDGADLIAKVCVNYPIDTVTQCKLDKRGLNDTYLVKTNTDHYFLRVYRNSWRDRQSINFELTVLDFLRQQQQPISYPLPGRGQQFLSEVIAPEGKRYAALFTHPQGKAVKQKLNVVQSYIFGRTLAQIHNCLDHFPHHHKRIPRNRNLHPPYLLDWSLQGIGNLYPNQDSRMDTLKDIIVKTKRQFKQLNLSAIASEYGICMGDVHAGNAHFTSENQVTLWDFEQCGYGWRVFDIAKFLQASIKMHVDAEVRNCFVDGYQDVRELSDVELTAIPLFVKVAHIWVMGMVSHTFPDVIGYGEFDDDWLDERLAILDSWE